MYYVFVGPKSSSRDLESLGVDESDKIFQIEPTDSTMAHLLAKCGKFKSVKEGKVNGWNIPVPTGFADYEIGKNAKKIFVMVWNPSTTLEEFRCSDCLPDGTCVC